MNNLYGRWNVVLSIAALSLLLGWYWLGWLTPTVEAAGVGSGMESISVSYDSSLTFNPLLKPLRVTTTADSGTGSLRWAIGQANAAPDDDLIDLSGIEGAIALQSPLPSLTTNQTWVGSTQLAISGENQYRVLQIDDGDITIRDLTLANGLAQGKSGLDGGGGSAGMGGGLLINQGTVRLVRVNFLDNQAIGGSGSQRLLEQAQIPDQVTKKGRAQKTWFKVNRGAVSGVNGASLADLSMGLPDLKTVQEKEKYRVNRGAIAGVNGVGVNGIGSIVFGGGGGFGGFANGGNGGNGGNAGANGGSGGNGGDGGDGGMGIFGSFGRWEQDGSVGAIAFGGGGGFGGYGNAGNGGNGGNATTETANGGNGGSGGNGGFGGGGGAGGFGGVGGNCHADVDGVGGTGGFGGGDGTLGQGGGGGGFGGAVFVRSGHLILHHTRFENNAALAAKPLSNNLAFSPALLLSAPAQGKGGAIFILPNTEIGTSTSASRGAAPSVLALGKPPIFVNNIASSSAELQTDNHNVYGVINLAKESASR